MTISIVLYGRNDNYGYNLHKRAALSLNCMASVLTDPSDEIIFVDYNTPDDFPTFPEAIQDTLTKRARDLLRILRVRPRVHERFRARTHLVALEPVARNIGVRRSCAANRWILSTNTDMVFVPQGAMSLSHLARDLPPGFYHTPRMEIPELLWESFDRKAPETVIATVREWGRTLHLNEIVLGAKFILYDGPGDFQLLQRDDLFAHHGFHEGMLLGWHVDSNIARRMYLKYGTVGDLGKQVYGYHCDHTRQVTAAHSHLQLQNDWRVFCDQVDTPDVPQQAETWGCAGEPIEEVRLATDPAHVYVKALRESIGDPLDEPRTIKFTHETFNKIDYDAAHVVPFLADMLATMPKESNLAWCGARTDTLSRFSIVWQRLAFTGKILADSELIRLPESNGVIQVVPMATLLSADVFVFDFGGLPGPAEKREHNSQISRQLLRRFMQMVQEERCRLSARMSPRRILALNAINNDFERLVRGYLAAAVTPCATHMRHGFVLPAETREDWLPLLYTGQAGIRLAHHVVQSDTRHVGTIAYGPYKYLPPAIYRVSLKIELASEELKCNGNEPCIGVEMRVGAEVLSVYLIDRTAVSNHEHEFLFKVPPSAAEVVEGVEARIWLFKHVDLTIRSLTIEPAPATAEAEAAVSVISPIALQIQNWLPYLPAGPLGRVDDDVIVAQRGPADFVVYGPYWPLPPNNYEAIICIEGLERQEERPSGVAIRADVISREQQLAAVVLSDRGQTSPTVIHLPFEVDSDSPEQRQIETRVWSSGEYRFRIRSLEVKPLGQSPLRDLLPFLVLGKGGRRVGSEITNVAGISGTIASSPILKLRAGSYRLILGVGVKAADEIPKQMQGYAIAQVLYGSELVAACEIGPDDSSEDHRLDFDVPTSLDPSVGFQFLLRTIAPAEIAVRTLSLDPVEAKHSPTGAAPFNLRNWIPFLHTGAGAQVDGNSIVVHAGAVGFVVYGPYWTLPAGLYELRASIIPHTQDIQEGVVVSCQVAADSGTHIIAEAKWRLSQYRNRTAGEAVEFRIPFRLAEDLAAAERTIETRIFTPGKARFRVRSLSVVQTAAPESDWFAYLTVEDCGIHTGTEIKSVPDKKGYLACTPVMPLARGHYRVLPDVSIESSRPGIVLFEFWSGSDLIALETLNSADQTLEFDVADDHNGQMVQLRIRLAAPVQLLIRHLKVEKSSSTVSPAWRRRAQAQRRGWTKHAQDENKKEPAPHSNLVRSIAARVIRRIKRPRD